MRRRIVGRMVGLLLLLAPLTANAARSDVIDLADYPMEKVWRCANSRVTPATDANGEHIWRWEIGSGEAFLWLNEDLPIHRDLPHFQRLLYEVNFAQGQINQFWPRTVGLLASPFDKMLCEWNLFYYTHPHKQWITYQQVLNDPSWFAHHFSQIPRDIQLDHSMLLGFACLAKGQSCVVELRKCRLVKDAIRVEKPYLTTPIGWPLEEQNGAAIRYRTPYFVKNSTSSPTAVKTALRSQHALFQIKVEPPVATLAAGATQRFDVVAAMSAPVDGTAPMAEETAVVEFIPGEDQALAYRTETFCTSAIPPTARRMVMFTPAELAAMRLHPVADADAQFWMSVDVENQTRIPGGIGHALVAGIPITCPKCKQGRLQVTPHWLQVKCDKCGYTEQHTLVADATWIGMWSEIHGAGPNPVALGRAYLASVDERYAKKAIALLTLLGRGYGQLTWHNAMHPDGWTHAEPATPDAMTNGASARWGNSPTYGTDFMVAGLAMMHNMVVDSPSWTEEQRKIVHEGFWVPVATELMKITPGISNMNDIINRDLILAGFSTGDTNMLYRGTLYPTGIAGRMRDISPDGFSDEGSALNYHFAAMREWLPSIELLINSGINFPGVIDRAVAALKMPRERSSLSGLAYCTGNSGQAWFSVPLDHDMFKLADRILPADSWPRQRHYSSEPHLFHDAGWGILRSGLDADKQVMVNVDFGRSHGHGDLDRMNLGLLAFGVPLSADPGSSYNFNTNAVAGPAQGSMEGPLVANTVVVDGQHQIPGAGKLVEWQIKPDVQRLAAETDGVYLGVAWRRSVALLDGIVVVVDDLHSDKPHRYESAWHHYGHATIGEGCALSTLRQPLGDGPYEQVLNPKAISGRLIAMDWIYEGVHVCAWQPANAGQLTYTGQTGVCWENTRGLAVDGLYVRREGKTARFVTVLEPYKSTRVLKSVSTSDKGNATTIKLVFAAGNQREITFDPADAQ